MTMELPNYGFELILLSPLHAISMCQGGQGSQRPPGAARPGCARTLPTLHHARDLRTMVLVPPKTAGGGSPSPGTTSACLRATQPRHPTLGILPQAHTEPGLREDMFLTCSG